MSRIYHAIENNKAEAAARAAAAAATQLKVVAGSEDGESECDSTSEPGSEASNAPADDYLHARDVRLCPPDNEANQCLPSCSPRAGEQYRMLRTRVLRNAKKPQFVLISSATAGDGKTTTALNLAWALAVGGPERVLLIEGDLRKPCMHLRFGVPVSPGLAEVAAGECRLRDALIRIEGYSNLYVLPAGKAAVNPAELLSSRHWIQLCADVRRQFQFVIADSPPVAAATDYELIESKCDGALLVVRPDHTKRKLLVNALARTSPTKFMGVVLNSVPKWFMWKSEYYDYYKGNHIYGATE